MAIFPNSEAIQEFLQNDYSGPVDMVNLLRFKPEKRSEYQKYIKGAVKLMGEFGMEILYQGDVISILMGGDEVFQAVAIMRYPSKKKFLEFSSSPRRKEIEQFRTNGLESQWLIATKEIDSI